MSKVANSVLVGAVTLYALRKYDPGFLYDAQNNPRFGEKTNEIVAAAVAGLVYWKGPNFLDQFNGKFVANADVFSPDMLNANMAQAFRGQAGVASGIDLSATFTE